MKVGEMRDVFVEINWMDFMDIHPRLIPSVISQKLREGGFKMKPAPRIFLNEDELQEIIEKPFAWWDTQFGRMFAQRISE